MRLSCLYTKSDARYLSLAQHGWKVLAHLCSEITKHLSSLGEYPVHVILIKTTHCVSSIFLYITISMACIESCFGLLFNHYLHRWPWVQVQWFKHWTDDTLRQIYVLQWCYSSSHKLSILYTLMCKTVLRKTQNQMSQTMQVILKLTLRISQLKRQMCPIAQLRFLCHGWPVV